MTPQAREAIEEARLQSTDHPPFPADDYADEFEFGLDLILSGLERVRDTA